MIFKIGIIAKRLISIPIHILNQFEDDIVIIELKIIINKNVIFVKFKLIRKKNLFYSWSMNPIAYDLAYFSDLYLVVYAFKFLKFKD